MISEDEETSVMYSTVEPRYNGVASDWQNLFTITRFCYIEVLFHNYVLQFTGVRKIVCYAKDFLIEVCYIEVPQMYM